MDRDMVNCLHHLYQLGRIELQLDMPEFWCGADTAEPLKSRQIVLEHDDNTLRFAPGIFDLIDMVEDQLRSLPKPDFAFGYPISNQIRGKGDTRPAFLAISYAPEFDAIKSTVLAAADTAGFLCEVTGDLANPGDIMDQVWQGIRGADVVVADVTGSNPNVFYELGLAHALGKEVILMTQDANAPFDIRSSRRISYDATDLTDLEAQLKDGFNATSARYPHEGPEPRF